MTCGEPYDILGQGAANAVSCTRAKPGAAVRCAGASGLADLAGLGRGQTARPTRLGDRLYHAGLDSVANRFALFILRARRVRMDLFRFAFLLKKLRIWSHLEHPILLQQNGAYAY